MWRCTNDRLTDWLITRTALVPAAALGRETRESRPPAATYGIRANPVSAIRGEVNHGGHVYNAVSKCIKSI